MKGSKCKDLCNGKSKHNKTLPLTQANIHEPKYITQIVTTHAHVGAKHITAKNKIRQFNDITISLEQTK